ncbi:LacI family DNA-binding transcriptional regulator [Streptomyces sp. VRA16 Mangrove soil]|uniref:LacI family DNA-binding transcriptional regulator n=1 Tax=Streptomyces sp. VRA16 Mangrove soil TaxID=2817434 RepID=UPI001A9D430A|nr:LacI family DNA-binding transcriptional regulator [Streptomyces sp. VRA16 Mangrove soil]MBO1334570.1 LacI family DNA-binding transcriptional regulator [Streptomyces sp. VRA16 Mangrove soil]
MPYAMVQKPQIPNQQPASADATGTARGSAPTSADVARLAGVSRATVSYVLNNTSAVRISEPTRRRVHEAARELGYVPHAAARSLRAGHTRIVLMPTPDVPIGPLYSGFLNEFQWALSRLDYTVVQYGSVGVVGDEAARAWAELRPVAVLAPLGMGRRGIDVLKRSGAKAVMTLGPEPVEGAHALLTDHREVGRVAGEHLRERGHDRIGVVMPREEGLDVFAQPRLEGVRATGAEVVPVPLAYTEDDAAQVAEEVRESGLDAVFAYNDEYAMLLMRALQDAGVDIPGDVAVIGADDLMLGRLLRPRLSTVRLAMPSGEELAELVDRLVRDPAAEPEAREVLAASLVRREST